MTDYVYEPNEDRTECKIYKGDKYLGTVIAAPDGRSLQNFAHDVMWLPVHRAMVAMGKMSEKEAHTLEELGF